MSSKLMIQLTPPRPSDKLATMAPREYLQHRKLRSRLKSKSAFDFTAERQQKLELDPQEESSDSSILDYKARVGSILPDRETLHVLFPYDDIIEESRVRFEILENQVEAIPQLKEQIKSRGDQSKNLHLKNEEIVARLQALEVKHQALEVKHQALEVKNQALEVKDQDNDARLKILEAENATNAKARLKMFIANLLVKLIDKVSEILQRPLPEGTNNTEHSTTKYQTFAKDLPYDKKAKLKWKEETKLKTKYIKTVKNLPKYQKQRNKAAHETQYHFARLLLSDRYRGKHPHNHYGPLFEYVYGMTVEDAAKVEIEEDFLGEDELSSDEE